MELINYTKKTINFKKTTISYPDSEEECIMMDCMLRILKTLHINISLKIIDNSNNAYKKNYPFGITTEDLIEIKNSNFFLSFENNYHDSLDVKNKTENYLNYALDFKYNVIKCFNLDSILEEIIFVNILLQDQFLPFKERVVFQEKEWKSFANQFDQLRNIFHKNKIYIIYDEQYSNINSQRSIFLNCEFIYLNRILESINSIDLKSSIIIIMSDISLDFLMNLILKLHVDTKKQEYYFHRNIKFNADLSHYHFFVSRNKFNQIEFASVLFLICDIVSVVNKNNEVILDLKKLILLEMLNIENKKKNLQEEINSITDNIVSNLKKSNFSLHSITEENLFQDLITSLGSQLHLESNQDIYSEDKIYLKYHIQKKITVKDFVYKIRNGIIFKKYHKEFVLKRIFYNNIEIFPNEAFWHDEKRGNMLIEMERLT